MELIVIAKPTVFKGETHLINQLFGAGLQVFHLRKENADEATYREIIEGILPEYHPQVALHHFHSLVSDYNIQRIHHTESLRKNIDLKKMPEHSIFSTSIHQLSDVDKLSQYDYCFFGPVFNSLSKPGYFGVIPSGFRLDKKVDRPKIIALGGVALNQIEQLKEMNFDGIALLGAIWNDPSQALDTFKKAQAKCQVYS